MQNNKFLWVAGRLGLSLLAISLLFAGAETAFRILRLVRPSRCIQDRQLGWTWRPFAREQKQGIRVDGKAYDIDWHTEENGFLVWGEPQSGKTKVLIIGDSYTAAEQVSNTNAYYAQLDKLMGTNYEFFVYGMGGYGNCQEYLILHLYKDVIKPDIIIWQWCSNDLWNNSFALDDRSANSFSINPRPYLENGNIRIRYPHATPLLSRHSKLWQWIAPRIWKRIRPYIYPSGMAPHDRFRPEHPFFKESIETTGNIMALFKLAAGKAPVYGFVVSAEPEITSIYRTLAQANGIVFIGGLNEYLQQQRNKGIPVNAHAGIGSHWSNPGHRLVAEYLYSYLRDTVPASRELIPEHQDP